MIKINLVAIGTRMPEWVQAGFADYQKRIFGEIQLNLIELPAIKRFKNSEINKILQQESQAVISAIPNNNLSIALDRNGKIFDTLTLSTQLQQWIDSAQSVSLLIGGPEGLTQDCINSAQHTWSLSALTLPHPLVRILIAEQIYRAWSILKGHPYHR